MTTSTAKRNRYIDALRAAAIVRVVIYHAFGWSFLTILLPSMGVMFALAGSLMAASMQKYGARRAITSRMRRLLPALWVLGAVAVPLMMWHGWRPRLAELAFWIFPINDPPSGSSWGEPFTEVLWYIRAYLLFVLASPILYFLYRRTRWAAVTLPLAGLAALMITGFRLPDPWDGIMWDFVTYAACWIAGFAYQDGSLARLSKKVYLPAVAALASAGFSWLCTHPTMDGSEGYDLNDIPVARTLWSLAFVLFVLRIRPTLSGLDAVPWLGRAISFVNSRAVTIYLWHYPLISVGAWFLGERGVPWATPEYILLMMVTETVLVIAAVLLFGWVEDVSSKRRPRLWPVPKREPVVILEPQPQEAPTLVMQR